jgi:hypothetical protein
MASFTTSGMAYVLGGVPVAPVPFGPNSKYFFVAPATGSDSNDGSTPEKAFATVDAGEDALTANRNDTLIYMADSSGTNLSAALTWDKSYTNFTGVCAPSAMAQRARIFQTSTLTGASPLLNITASGCTFRNFYIFQGVNDATSLINVQVTGGRNYLENVHFAGGGHASHAINGGASLKLAAAEENLFVNCTIGVDTIGAATGFVGLLFDTGAKRNEFRNCRVIMEAAHTGAAFMEVADATGITHWNLFDGCVFINSSSTITMAEGAILPAVTTGGVLLMKDCMAYKITKWDNDNRGVIYGSAIGYTAADLASVAVAFHV